MRAQLSLLSSLLLLGLWGRPGHTSCPSLSLVLLQNLTAALQENEPFKGINCTEQDIELNTMSHTVSTCQPSDPQGGACSKTANTFDQKECLQNMAKDLCYYRDVLHKYSNTVLNTFLLKPIEDLTKECFPSAVPRPAVEVEKSQGRKHTFNERLHMCKILRGFQVRAVTIARVLSYISVPS